MNVKNLVSLIAIAFLITSCMNNQTKNEDSRTQTSATPANWETHYTETDADKIPDNVIELIGQQWMLVTAGTPDSYNTMTASWGGIGFIWQRPAAFTFIRDVRYTYEFLQREESFTLSFFPEEYKKALQICGTKSGRDTDKVKEAGLTPVETPSGLMSFGEARMILECKKMLVQQLDTNHLTSPYQSVIVDEAYTKEESLHQLFISEITKVWIKK